MHIFRRCPYGLTGTSHQLQQRHRQICQADIDFAGPFQVMLVLLPITILLPMQTILHLPVISNRLQKLRRSNRIRVNTAHKEPRITRLHRAIRTVRRIVHASKDLTTRHVQPLSDMFSVLNVAPYLSDFDIDPFFSTVAASGLSGSTSAKQVFAASSMSG